MSAQDTFFYANAHSLNCLQRGINLPLPAVMGILNVTPDSFFDGGRYTHEEAILIRAEQMLEQGAGIIDIGAASSRPGSKPVPEKEERNRLLSAITAVRKHFPSCLISADTYRSALAKDAVAAGADLINDISGGSLDARMFATVAALKVPYVLMHMQGTPDTMQVGPSYSNVMEEVTAYFAEKIKELNEAGVTQLILDPGFGFGKTVDHNFELLSKLHSFQSLGFPIMAGLSRKSMINKAIGSKPETALNGTTAANTIALLKGASLLRVHDVKEAVEAIQIVGRTLK